LDDEQGLRSEIYAQESGSFREDHSGAGDLLLVQQAQAGDTLAFSRLVQPHMRLMYHVALRITGNREDAEDASQQSLLKEFTRLDQFNGESLFSTWLTRIAINEALMKIRKRRTEDCHLLHETHSEQESNPIELLRADEDDHPELLYAKWERERFLRDAINGLEETSRDVVWLLGMQERKTKEAAGMLNLSVSAVKSRFLRARQQLRQSLKDRI
jgi:RNA polymerase sigma-70 factor (ECF subfamily)